MEKSRLLKKNRRFVEKIEIDVDGEKEVFDLRKPTMGDRIEVYDQAKAAGELDEDNTPVGGPRIALKFNARAAACVLYDPETGQRKFGEEDLEALVDTHWLEEIQPRVDEVFKVKEEAARKNS